MATVRSPSSVPARKMRMAISLRLAASNFLNGRPAPLGASDLLRLVAVMRGVFIVGRGQNGNQRGEVFGHTFSKTHVLSTCLTFVDWLFNFTPHENHPCIFSSTCRLLFVSFRRVRRHRH